MTVEKWNPIFVNGGEPHLSRDHRSSNALDFPLRAKGNRLFVVNPYQDWMSRFLPKEWQSLMLATMALATRHTFVTVTEDGWNLLGMLKQIDSMTGRTISVPADKSYIKEFVRVNKELTPFKEQSFLTLQPTYDQAIDPPKAELTVFQKWVRLPWIPRNIVFGVRLVDQEHAEEIVNLLKTMKHNWDIRTAVYAPGMDFIPWQDLGFVDWADYIFLRDEFEVVNEPAAQTSVA